MHSESESEPSVGDSQLTSLLDTHDLYFELVAKLYAGVSFRHSTSFLKFFRLFLLVAFVSAFLTCISFDTLVLLTSDVMLPRVHSGYLPS